MKKYTKFLLLLALIVPLVAACSNAKTSSNNNSSSSSSTQADKYPYGKATGKFYPIAVNYEVDNDQAKVTVNGKQYNPFKYLNDDADDKGTYDDSNFFDNGTSKGDVYYVPSIYDREYFIFAKGHMGYAEINDDDESDVDEKCEDESLFDKNYPKLDQYAKDNNIKYSYHVYEKHGTTYLDDATLVPDFDLITNPRKNNNITVRDNGTDVAGRKVIAFKFTNAAKRKIRMAMCDVSAAYKKPISLDQDPHYAYKTLTFTNKDLDLPKSDHNTYNIKYELKYTLYGSYHLTDHAYNERSITIK